MKQRHTCRVLTTKESRVGEDGEPAVSWEEVMYSGQNQVFVTAMEGI